MAKKIKKILICVANAEHSKNALIYASEIARKHDYVIEILSIIDTSNNSYAGLFSVEASLKKEQREKIEQEISALSSSIATGLKVAINIKEGFIAKEIEDTITSDKSIKMMVLAASPSSTSNGKLIPYITEKLVEKHLIPTFIIPSTIAEKDILCLT